jgi:hypothetical protein
MYIVYERIGLLIQLVSKRAINMLLFTNVAEVSGILTKTKNLKLPHAVAAILNF